jgi:hypothetical protein
MAVQEAHPLLRSLGPISLAVPIRGATRKAAVAGSPTKAEGVEVTVEGVIGWDALVEVLHMLVHVPEWASGATVVFYRIAMKEPDPLVI